jgi:septal ring factor EnvC (AmiA/AmiB activator)
MPKYYSELIQSFFVVVFMEQLVALCVEPGDQDSAAKFNATLKNALADEKLGQEKAQMDAETLSWVVKEIKKTTNHLMAHVPSLETQVKNLNNKIVDLNTELGARELFLEQTTAAKDDFQHQSTRLMNKLEGKYSSSRHLSLITLFY